MNLTKHFCQLFFSICLCNACTPQLYVPAPPNMPLAGNKGEFKGDLFLYSNEFGLQASYAVDSHCVVLVNVTGQDARTGTTTVNNTNTYYSTTANFQGDIGAGYFKKIGQRGRFEAIGGIGYGGSKTQNVITHSLLPLILSIDNINGNFAHLFAQCDVGYVNKNIELGLGLRFSNLNINGTFQSSYIGSGTTPQYTTQLGGDALFWEPAIMFAAGFEKVKLNLSFGISNKLFGPDISSQYGSIYQNMAFSFGISCNLNRKLEQINTVNKPN